MNIFRMWNRLFNRGVPVLTEPVYRRVEPFVHRIPPPVVKAKGPRTLSRSWCANNEGESFMAPAAELHLDWFWKQDEKGGLWRLYRRPVKQRGEA